jgi:hypothetical protein
MRPRDVLPRVFMLALPLAFGCGESRINIDPGADAAQAMPDSATSGDDGPGGEPGACGRPPYVTLGLLVRGGHVDGTTTPVEGATFTTPLCPGLTVTSDVNGRFTGRLSAGVPFYGRFIASGYVNTLTPEQKYDVDTADIKITLLPVLITALLPNYDATQPAIFLGVMKDTGVNACANLDGVSFQVVGHPEAVITYYSNDTIPQPIAGATATSAKGYASVSGLAAQDPVPIVATKPGCMVLTATGASTGRAPLEGGYITEIGAYLEGGETDAGDGGG